MASTASERISKRRINELEQKLKKLQREIREFKLEKKLVGNLRKQALRAIQAEAEYHEVIEEMDADLLERETKKASKNNPSPYQCKDIECVNARGYKSQNNCITIEAGSRLIIICQDCGKRYSVEAKNLNHHH